MKWYRITSITVRIDPVVIERVSPSSVYLPDGKRTRRETDTTFYAPTKRECMLWLEGRVQDEINRLHKNITYYQDQLARVHALDVTEE